jgi:uncharacterized membrane protein YsdA (DUF1294 family)
MENPLFLLWPALAAVNIFSFALVGFDKKKSFEQGERSPEVLFFLLAVLFGSLGVFLGIFVFHHKTRKVYFPVGIGLMLIQQIALLYLLSKNF